MKRIETGVLGLDGLIGGGLLDRTITLVTGPCGAGKTLFGIGFVNNGAIKQEPGVLACFNEPPSKMRANAKVFGWNLASLEAKSRLILVDASTARSGLTGREEYSLRKLNFEDALHFLLGACNKIGAKRLAIDSLSGLLARVDNKRNALLRLASSLEQENITAVVTAEFMGVDEGFVEEHLADTVILLKKSAGCRTLEIKKMRGSQHSLYEHPYSIGETGLVVDKAAVTV